MRVELTSTQSVMKLLQLTMEGLGGGGPGNMSLGVFLRKFMGEAVGGGSLLSQVTGMITETSLLFFSKFIPPMGAAKTKVARMLKTQTRNVVSFIMTKVHGHSG